MSVEAITWALAQPVERSSTKFVLVAMANCGGTDGLCWPSVQYLCDATSQDRKTVLENLRRLREAGYIIATDERRGSTAQVVVYRLNSANNGTVKESQNRNSTEKGTVPKTPAKSPVIPSEESRFSAGTGPKTGHGTINEPSGNRQGNHQKPAVAPKPKAPKPETVDVETLMAAGFDAAVAAEFIAHKAARKAPLTGRAWRDHLSESAKAGWTPLQAAEKVMAKNWSGFEARYVADKTVGQAASASTKAERDAKARRLLGMRQPQGDFIDG